MTKTIDRYRQEVDAEYTLLTAEISLHPDGPMFHLARSEEASELLFHIAGEAGEEWMVSCKSRLAELLQAAAMDLAEILPGEIKIKTAPQAGDVPVYRNDAFKHSERGE